MPRVDFESLPDDARVWIFGASEPPDPRGEALLLAAVDEWLEQWRAHDEPLTCAREWRDGRFLVVGVDQSTAGASGCSVDALFRRLRGMQDSVGADLVGGGRVFYRDEGGVVRDADRSSFAAMARRGEVRAGTPVFDATITRASEYRCHFERPAAESWHAALMT